MLLLVAAPALVVVGIMVALDDAVAASILVGCNGDGTKAWLVVAKNAEKMKHRMEAIGTILILDDRFDRERFVGGG